MSLTLLTLATIAIIFASIHAGNGLYQFLKKRNASNVIEPSSAGIGAMMGLLAFMLAFAFSMGAHRLEVRQSLLVEEINAIGTLHLRSDFLPEPARSATKALIAEYTKLRVDLAEDISTLGVALKRSEEISTELWSTVNTYRIEHPNEIATLSLIEATNTVIDLYSARVFAHSQHIPVIIWATLIAMTVLAMIAMGYQMGVSGKLSILLSVILALTFSAVLMLIADLDRYDEGFFRLPDQPIIQFYESIK